MTGKSPSARTIVTTALAAALALVLLGGAVWLAFPRGGGTGVTSSGSALIGGDFTLTDQNGATVTMADLKGKPTIMFFGFTHCPDICPTTLFEMSQVLAELGDDADKVNAIFVSVDPERDTPEVLSDYLQAFDPHIRALTGTPEEIAGMARAYRVYYKKVPLDSGGYTMDHTALVYLFDEDHEFVAPLRLKQDPEQAAAPVRELL